MNINNNLHEQSRVSSAHGEELQIFCFLKIEKSERHDNERETSQIKVINIVISECN